MNEWLRDGCTVYALEHAGWDKGKELLQNRWSFHVQRGPNTPAEECEAIAIKARAADDLLEALKSVQSRLGFAEWASPVHAEELLREMIDDLYQPISAAIRTAEGTET